MRRCDAATVRIDFAVHGWEDSPHPPDEVTHHHGCDGAMGRRCDGDGDDGATVPHRLGEVIHPHGSDGAMARRCDGDDSAPVDKVIHHRGSDGAMARRCDGATVRCDGARYPTVALGKRAALARGDMGSCPAGSVCVLRREIASSDIAMGRSQYIKI